jgi:hypothetical protein
MKFVLLAGAAASLAAAPALAAPIRFDAPQFQPEVAGAQQTSDGFVCPVISTDSVLNSPKGGTLSEGDFTIGGPDVTVPTRATNDDGAGSPDGAHASPGDTTYSAIWPNR